MKPKTHLTIDATPLIGSTSAAKTLHISVVTVRSWAAQGKLPSTRTADGTWLFDARDVTDLAAYRAAHPPAKRKGRPTMRDVIARNLEATR